MNEITVKINCSIEEIKELLEDKGFKIINKYLVDDTYYIAKDVKIDKASIKTILSDYILIRDIQQYDKELINSHKIVKITYKHKNIAPNGEIVNQEKYDCEIENKLDNEIQVYRLEEIFCDKKLSKIAKSLTYTEKLVIYLHYIEEQTDEQIAKVLFMTKEAISKKRLRAIKKIKNAYMKGEI